MGVYIKGMRMPENCIECISSDLRTAIKCTEWTEISAGRRENERAWSCPLVDLGKHGLLIDFDALIEKYWDGNSMTITAWDLKDINAVIEAEDSE